ncbi:MliC family protein [Aurantimonas sp. A2-1-M11]|uniref:MliC family protein n=1 Tax=Aurantimonas sp. A2-1-M11 TaxID=3113712 RepID=UPI002F956209
MHRKQVSIAAQGRALALGVAFAAMGALPALAQDGAPLTLDLEGPAERTRVTYLCRDEAEAEPVEMVVEYINLPSNSLAILPVNGRATLFVDVISGSGAKYAAGEMVWWTKGRRGDLYSERRSDPSQTTVCQVRR